MRDIFFRAWDKELKQMFYSDDCFFCFQNGGLIERDGESSSFGSKNDIVMQYTGLKDKNSVEIYEGDIYKEILTGIVTYEAPSFWSITKLGSHSTIGGDGEVIGNIYENKELLK